MKKVLLSLLCLCFAIVSVRADLIWYESFDYPDGPINTVSGGLWAVHSGSSGNAYVYNKKLENAMSIRADDVNRKLCTTEGCSYTNAPQVLYVSFTVNCTNLPTATAYFAHFQRGLSTFTSRLFSLPGTLPNTWRLGIASGSTVNQVYPVDLATDTDYQVVVGWNPTASQVDQLYSLSSSLWVNPINSAETGLPTGDLGTAIIVEAYGFRQASGAGNWFAVITNLAVATTFDEAATNVWATNAVAPRIVYQPQSGTNYEGDNVTLSAVAAGQGLQSLTYQWRKNGSDFFNPAGNANTLNFAIAAVSDSGSYQVVVTTPYGLSATSTVAFLWVTNPPVPPTITQHPASTNAYYGQTVSLYCGATGPGGGLTYTWYHDNNPVSSEANPNVSGDGTPTLTIANLQTGNGTLGTYRCDVVNIYGTTPSSNAVVSASTPPAVSIYDLRGRVDGTYYLPTNTTALWSVTGVVTVYTNLTGPANMSIMIQDDTAGISVYWPTHGADRPAVGDSITAIGTLGHFNSMLQLNISASDPSHGMVTNSHNNPLPAPYPLPLSFTNGVDFGGVSNVVRTYTSSRVTLTNVYFVNAGGTFPLSGSVTEIITNANGDSFRVFFNYGVTAVVAGQPIPTGPVNITAPLTYYLGATAPDRSAGFEIIPTRYEDIAAATPPVEPVTITSITATSISYTGGAGAQFVLLESTDLTVPLSAWTRAQTQAGTPGSFTIAPSGTRKFYSIKSE